MYEISKLPPAITLGYQGESLARTIEVDCTDWLSDYPAGTMAATILLPGYGGVAPLPVDMDGAVMSIPVTRGMTVKAGRGSINLKLLDGEVEKRSAVVPIYIQASHPPVSGEMPDPVQDWVSAAQAKLGEVDHFVDDTIDATEAANAATVLTNAAILRAQTAIGLADDATLAANTAASLANTKAGLADSKAALANASAGLAVQKAGLADSKAALANDAATLANYKAGLAGTATTSANAAAVRAENGEDERENAEELRVIAEQGRHDAYELAEAARDGLYNAAESGRDGLFEAAETTRNAQTGDAIDRANAISETLEDIAPKWAAVDISASGLAAGAAPTASVTQDETGTSISLGIPKGDPGDTGPAGPQGLKGDPGESGLSAYAQAVTGGYTGTLSEFYADLAALDGLAAELAGV